MRAEDGLLPQTTSSRMSVQVCLGWRDGRMSAAGTPTFPDRLCRPRLGSARQYKAVWPPAALMDAGPAVCGALHRNVRGPPAPATTPLPAKAVGHGPRPLPLHDTMSQRTHSDGPVSTLTHDPRTRASASHSGTKSIMISIFSGFCCGLMNVISCVASGLS